MDFLDNYGTSFIYGYIAIVSTKWVQSNPQINVPQAQFWRRPEFLDSAASIY